MPVPWFLLSLALGRNPVVLSLERVVGPQDTARCSPLDLSSSGRDSKKGERVSGGGNVRLGSINSDLSLPLSQGLSCHLWDGDVLCLPGSLASAPGPVLVPTRLQTELVLRCHEETDCDLCVRVAVHLAVHGYWGDPDKEEKFRRAADPELEEPRNVSLQAHVVLSFQAYPTAHCVLLEVQVPAALVQPGQSVGSVVFDCFEAALGAEVQIWSYTQPRYQKELNLTQQLPALPWLNVSADGEDVRLVLDVSEEQHFGLSLYWNQAQGPIKPWWHSNLTGPQTITLNHTDLVPCLCIQVSTWEKIQLQECLWADSLGPLKDDMLLVETRGPQDNGSLCALEPSGCTPLLSRASTLWDNDLGALWACPMDKYIHQRWVLVWLACLLLVAVLFLLLLLKMNHVKGWLRLLKEDIRAGAAARSRAALLLYSADDASFERLVGALASALCQLPLRVAVDLWSRRDLSAQGALAWFHAQRRQTLQEGGVVVLLFSPGAVALCREWLQDATSAPRAHGPHDAFTASLSCVLPDFLQGRAPGRYVGAYFDKLLPADAVPALFRSVPVFSLPSQLPDFLGTLQGPAAPRPRRLAERAEQVSRALQPALDSCFRPPAALGTGRGMGPEAGDRT
ncbi:hypothetical protein G4228_016117 [Cervus hanglu yarkandensis]|nr:hypothetical protein G4228_016117 [Cervus hanglu yarkandensis]